MSWATLLILMPGARRSSKRVMCGPATVPTIFASTPKWPSASTSRAAVFSCPAVSGRGCSVDERRSSVGLGRRHWNSGSSVTEPRRRPCGVRSSAATGSARAARRSHRARRPRRRASRLVVAERLGVGLVVGAVGARRRRASSGASSGRAAARRRCRESASRPTRSRASRRRRGAGRRRRGRLDVRRAHDHLAVGGLGRGEGLGGGAGLAAGVSARGLAGRPRRRRAGTGTARPIARVVSARPEPVARSTPATRRAGQQQDAGDEQEQREDVRADRRDRRATPYSSASPTIPPRGSKNGASQ